MNVSSVSCHIPQPVKTLFVPALAVGAVVGDFEQHHGQHHQSIALGNSLAGIGTSVFLYRFQRNLLPILAPVAMWVHTRSKKTKEEKIKSVIQDTVWLASGCAGLELLSGKYNSHGERRGFFHNSCGFAIGALILAPFINKLLFGKNSGHGGHDSGHGAEHEGPMAYPISMDRYGILTNLLEPMHHAQKTANSSHSSHH